MILVAYNYFQPLRNKIFNYIQIAFWNSNTSLICWDNNIEHSDLVDNFYGHVITWDLDIIENKILNI